MSKLDRKVLRVYRAAMRWYDARSKGAVMSNWGELMINEDLLEKACAAAKKGKRK